MSLLFDIPLGNHAELFTYGLFPTVAPPVPSFTGSPSGTLGIGQSGYSFNGSNSAANTGGSVFTVPPNCKSVQWSFYLTSTPAAATVVLQASLDGVHFYTIDYSLEPTGATKVVQSGAPFYRIGTGGIDVGIPIYGIIKAQ